MPELGLLALFLRELLTRSRLPRDLRPLAALRSDELIEAMQQGGGRDGQAAAGYLYHSAQITRTIAGCGVVLDLGCGTAVQLLDVARLNPHIRFVGVDSCFAVLQVASRDAAAMGLSNVSFVCADCAPLSVFASHAADGVISTMTLHHLREARAVELCLHSIADVLCSGGALYLEDFARLRTAASIDYLTARGRQGAATPFSRLYSASLHAAFGYEEIKQIAQRCLPGDVASFHTVPARFLVVLKTPPRSVAADARERLRRDLAALSASQRTDYRDLATAFRLGGLTDALEHSD